MFESTAINFTNLAFFSIIVKLLFLTVGYYPTKYLLGKKYHGISVLERISYGIFIGVIVVTFSISLTSLVFPSLLVVSWSIVILPILWLFYKTHRIFSSKSVKEKLKSITCSKIKFKILWHVILPIILLALIEVMSANFGAGLYGSTMDDNAAHTLFVRCILENGRLVNKATPWYSYILFYPPASHIIVAFVETITGYPLEKIAVSFSSMIPSLLFLAFYAVSKTLFKDTKVALFSAITSFLAEHFWFDICYTFTVPFVLYGTVSIMGLSFLVLHSEDCDSKPLLVSLLLSFSIYLYSASFVYSFLFMFSISLFKFRKLVKSKDKKQYILLALFKVFICLFFTLVLSLPQLHTIYEYSVNSLQGLPSDWIPPKLREGQKTDQYPFWRPGFLLDIVGLIKFVIPHGAFLYLAPLSIMLLIAVFIILKVSGFKHKRFKSISEGAISLIFFFFLMLQVLKLDYTTPFNLVFTRHSLQYYVPPMRLWIMLFIPCTFLSAFSLLSLIFVPFVLLKCLKDRVCTLLLRDRRVLVRIKKVKWIRIMGLLVAAILYSYCLFNTVYFLDDGAVRYLSNPLYAYNKAYSHVRELSLFYESDILMFEFIKEELPDNAVILVNRQDVGQYITSVTGRKSIYPPFSLYYSRSYQLLSFALGEDPSNPYILPCLRSYNITHVFIGSIRLPDIPLWKNSRVQHAFFDPSKMIKSPFFKVVKRYGNTWLFEVNYGAENSSLISMPITVFTAVHEVENFNNLSYWRRHLQRGEIRIDDQNIVPNVNSIRLVVGEEGICAIFKPQSTLNLSTYEYILLWLKSNVSHTIRVFIYDMDKNFNFWTINISQRWEPILLNLNIVRMCEDSTLDLSNIIKVTFDMPHPLPATINIGSISLLGDLELIRTSKQLGTNTYLLNLSGHNNYLLLLPDFLELESIDKEPINIINCETLVAILCKPDLSYTLRFASRMADPASLVNYLLIRQIDGSFESDATFDLWTLHQVRSNSFPACRLDSNNTFTGTSSIKVVFNRTYSMFIMGTKNKISIEKGIIYLAIYTDLNVIGDRPCILTIFPSLNDAVSLKNVVFHTYLNRNLRWTVLPFEVSNMKEFWVRIDNLDALGEVYIDSILIYTYGNYY